MLSDKQNLLDYLTYNLTPKDIERKQFGEILTPHPSSGTNVKSIASRIMV